MPNPMLSLKQSAAIIGVHWKTIYNHVLDRTLPAYKVGRQWRIKREDLNKWVEGEKE